MTRRTAQRLRVVVDHVTSWQQPREPIDYDAVRAKYAAFREARLRDDGTAQYTSDIETVRRGEYATDPWADADPAVDERAPLADEVEVLIIGGGFSALLTSAQLRAQGVESIRIVEKGADVGGTWYWNRYPGVACDVCAYDYMPLLDELDYVPTRYYAQGPEILEHCRTIAQRFDLYDLAVFRTTVSSTTWDEDARIWRIGTDRGDAMRAKFVIVANGTLSKPKLPSALVGGLERFAGDSFHTSRWDYTCTGEQLEKLNGKRVGIVGTGASAVQSIPELAAQAQHLFVFQRTPSSIDVRKDFATDPNWARKLKPGYFGNRRERMLQQLGKRAGFMPAVQGGEKMSSSEKAQRAEEANIRAMARIHERIDNTVHDPAVAEALKPHYMIGCKRPTFHDGFLPVFNQENVTLVDTNGQGIDEVNEHGVSFAGIQYPLDVLILATGFEVQKTGIWNRICGVGGLELQDKYRTGVRTLLGVHSRGFPNLFIMGGYQASFSFNLVDILKTQGDHIARCIGACRQGSLATGTCPGTGGSVHDIVMDVSEAAEEWWVQQVIANRGKSNYSANCTPGYYNFEGDAERRRQDGNFNGGVLSYYEHVNAVGDSLGQHFEFS